MVLSVVPPISSTYHTRPPWRTSHGPMTITTSPFSRNPLLCLRRPALVLLKQLYEAAHSLTHEQLQSRTPRSAVTSFNKGNFVFFFTLTVMQ